MFEHVRKLFPWRTRAQRKQEFIKKLREPGYGIPKVRFDKTKTLVAGTMIMIHDYSTNDVISAVYDGRNWMLASTSSTRPVVKTSVEFEDMLTDMRNAAAAEDKLLINDSLECLDIDHLQHVPSLGGFHKLHWKDLSCDEEK